MGRNFTICFSGVAALAADRAEAAYRALRVPEAEARRTAHGALQRGRHLKCPAAQGGQLTEVIISRDVPGPPKSISGAHFNPAVTVAVMLTGRNKIDSGPMMGLAYMVTQNLAGLCAGLTYSSVMGAAFSLGPIEPFGWFAAAAAEILFTFLLCFVVLCVATVRTFNCGDMNGLAIGSCVIVGGFASGAISGGCMNPAISFGVDTSHSFKHGGWPYHWIFYNLMALGGAALAWGMFWLTRPNEFTKSGGVLLPSWAKAKGRQVGKAPFANPLVQKGFVPAGSPPPANPLVQKGFVPAPPSDHAGE
jgi:aquaporin Z